MSFTIHKSGQIDALTRIFLRFQLIVAGCVQHPANDGVVVQHPQERLRLLILAHLRKCVSAAQCKAMHSFRW